MVGAMTVVAVDVPWEIGLWVLQTRHIFGQGDSPWRVRRNNNGRIGSGAKGGIVCGGGNAEYGLEGKEAMRKAEANMMKGSGRHDEAAVGRYDGAAFPYGEAAAGRDDEAGGLIR